MVIFSPHTFWSKKQTNSLLFNLTDFITVDGGERVGHPAPSGDKDELDRKGWRGKEEKGSGFGGDQERRFGLNLKGEEGKIYK